MTAGTAQKISNAVLSCAAGFASFLFSLTALLYFGLPAVGLSLSGFASAWLSDHPAGKRLEQCFKYVEIVAISTPSFVGTIPNPLPTPTLTPTFFTPVFVPGAWSCTRNKLICSDCDRSTSWTKLSTAAAKD